jgi:hypothetical protein
MPYTQHKCKAPLRYTLSPDGSMTLTGVRAQGRDIYEGWDSTRTLVVVNYNGAWTTMEWDVTAASRGEPVNKHALRLWHDSGLRSYSPHSHPFAICGDASLFLDEKPRHQFRIAGDVREEFEEWAAMNVRSTLWGMMFDKWMQVTAVSFERLPTVKERGLFRLRWA